jgi:hypothetical protein
MELKVFFILSIIINSYSKEKLFCNKNTINNNHLNIKSVIIIIIILKKRKRKKFNKITMIIINTFLIKNKIKRLQIFTIKSLIHILSYSYIYAKKS